MMDGSLSFITALVGLLMSAVVLGVLVRRKQKTSNIITLVAYQSLGSKKGVAALRVGNELLVIGVMPNGFRVLKTMEASAVLEKKEERLSEKVAKLRKLKEDINA